MDDHDDLDAPLREEELLVLQSIYPDYVTSLEEDTLRLEIPIELGSRVTVRCSASKSSNSGSDSEGTITVAHLPPILLNVKLPSRYPSEQPAVISSAYVTGSWLPNTFRLTETLQSMWTPGEGILCQWTELIQSGDILEDLDVMDERGLLQLTHSSPTTLLSLLAAYDAKVSSTIFAQTSFACSICLTSLKGANCIQLACLHVFCRPCLQDYWGLCIKEGDVSRVCCPDPECVKKGDEAKEEDVRRVVSEDEVRRWKWLLVKRSMEKDPSIVHCPRPMCQAAVPKDTGVSEESAWVRLRTCPDCHFAFCSFCKSAWHGTLNPCQTSATTKLLEEYLSLPEESPGRVMLERRFGKIFIMRLIKEREEEEANQKWLENSTMSCPKCKVHVEKSVGCNHMTCAKCGQHFCYRCGTKIDALNPYVHFSEKGGACYGKLFEFHHTDDDWQPVEGFDRL